MSGSSDAFTTGAGLSTSSLSVFIFSLFMLVLLGWAAWALSSSYRLMSSDENHDAQEVVKAVIRIVAVILVAAALIVPSHL